MSTIEASGGFLKASVLLFCVFSVSFVTFFVLWLEGTHLIMAAACRILPHQSTKAGVISVTSCHRRGDCHWQAAEELFSFSSLRTTGGQLSHKEWRMRLRLGRIRNLELSVFILIFRTEDRRLGRGPTSSTPGGQKEFLNVTPQNCVCHVENLEA